MGKKRPPVKAADFDVAVLARVSEDRFKDDLASTRRKLADALPRGHFLSSDPEQIANLAHWVLLNVIMVEDFFASSGDVRLGDVRAAVKRIEKARAELEAAHTDLLALTSMIAGVSETEYIDGYAMFIPDGDVALRAAADTVRQANNDVASAVRRLTRSINLPDEDDTGGPAITQSRRGAPAERFAVFLAKAFARQHRKLYGTDPEGFQETLRMLWRAVDGGEVPNESELLARIRARPDLHGEPTP